jgi:hypothetical protein
VFGPLFTPNGLQVIFCRQTGFDDALIRGHSAAPKSLGAKVSGTGKPGWPERYGWFISR